MKKVNFFTVLLAPSLIAIASLAHAQVKVGVIVSATGPAAALGQPQQRLAQTFPPTIGGQPATYIILDDATDANQAARAARRLTSEDKVDVILGPSGNLTAFPVLEIAAETKTPMITMAPASGLTYPVDEKRSWAFKSVMDENIVAEATVAMMKRAGVKTMGIIASSEAYGESWVAVLPSFAAQSNVKIVATERYGLADVTATGQTIRLLSAKPDAILIVGISTTAAMPHKALRERGYTGPIYQTYGSLNNEFLKVGGRDVEGALMLATNKFLILNELPAQDPVKQRMSELVKAFESKYGTGTAVPYIMTLSDSRTIASAAIEKAIKSGTKPGTPEFRSALRDQIEATTNLQLTQSQITFSPTNHTNIDKASVATFVVKNGKWTRFEE